MFFQKARYVISVSGINLALLFFVVYLISPGTFKRSPANTSLVSAEAVNRVVRASLPPPKAITVGKPVRLTITRLNIDLPIEDGIYNPEDGSWSLSGYHAQFAYPSAPANDSEGNTFIYGHNNKNVFGPLKKIEEGDMVQIFTDNGHVFSYKFEDAVNVKPDDTSVFSYKGPPILTIQTCSGNWNEWRRMFRFSFVKVEA